MKEIIEIFFGLTVGLPLTIIGLLGLLAIMGASILSGVTLLTRGLALRGAIVLGLIALVLLMAFDIVPGARAAGVPCLLIAGMLTFSQHQRLARSDEAMAFDPIIAITAVAGMVALAVPVFILMFNTTAG